MCVCKSRAIQIINSMAIVCYYCCYLMAFALNSNNCWLFRWLKWFENIKCTRSPCMLEYTISLFMVYIASSKSQSYTWSCLYLLLLFFLFVVVIVEFHSHTGSQTEYVNVHSRRLWHVSFIISLPLFTWISFSLRWLYNCMCRL